MSFYVILLASMAVLGFILYITGRSKFKDAVFLSVSFVILAVISSVRYDLGHDYSYVYGPFYQQVLEDISIPISSVRFEPGFVLLAKATSLFSQNYQILFVVTSVLTVALILFYYWLHSPNVYLSVFLFMCLGHYFCSMNFVRQFLAAAIALYCFPLLKKKTLVSLIKYTLIVLLASSIHQSALILLPFMIIRFIPLNKYMVSAYILFTGIIYINATKIVAFVTQYWYTQYDTEKKSIQFGFDFPYTAATAIVLMVILLGWRILCESDNRNTLYINCAFVSFFFSLMGTKHAILDRQGLYFAVLAPVTLAFLFEGVKDAVAGMEKCKIKTRGIVALAALTLLLLGGGSGIYGYILYQDTHGVVPYKTVYEQQFYKEHIRGEKGSGVNN